MSHLQKIRNFIADEESKAVRAKWKNKVVLPVSRWRSPACPGAGCLKATKSEARAYFKQLLGVDKLPVGFIIESY
jgi:hypothetical protein